MTLPSILFDVGAIGGVATQQVTPAEATIRDGAQFVQARRVNIPRRVWTLAWDVAPRAVADAVLDLYRRTFGGALPMTFSSPDSEGVFAVRFDDLSWTQNKARSASFTVRLLEV